MDAIATTYIPDHNAKNEKEEVEIKEELSPGRASFQCDPERKKPQQARTIQ
jgi:hypothetical protein